MKSFWLPVAAVCSCVGGCNLTASPTGAEAGAAANLRSPSTLPPLHFEGVWQGIVTPAASATSLPAVVLVNGWGEFRMVADGMQLVGLPLRTAAGIEGEVRGFVSAETTWDDTSRVADFTLSGTISEDGFIDAEYRGSAGSGMLAVADAVVDRPTDIQSLGGLWVAYDDTDNIVMTLEVDVKDHWSASIAGSHANGCTYVGKVEAWTSEDSYNLDELAISGCPVAAGTLNMNGNYAGTGALVDLQDDPSGDPVLVVALSSEANQVTLFLHRLTG